MDEFLLDSCFGLSPLIARELAFRTVGETDRRLFSLSAEDIRRFWTVFTELQYTALEERFTPVCLRQGEKPMAATGVSLETGLTNTTYLEAELKQRAVQHAGRVVLMADHSKFDYSSLISFFDFKSLYAVVTDQIPGQAYLDVIREHKILLMTPPSEKLKKEY